jgi:hypothetical protein
LRKPPVQSQHGLHSPPHARDPCKLPRMKPGSPRRFALIHPALASVALVLTASTAGASEIRDGEEFSYAPLGGARTCLLFPAGLFDAGACPGLHPIPDPPHVPGVPQRQVAIGRLFFDDRGAPAVAVLSINLDEAVSYEPEDDMPRFASEVADGMTASLRGARLRSRPSYARMSYWGGLPLVRVSFDVDGLADDARIFMEHVVVYSASSSHGAYSVVLSTTAAHAVRLDVIGDESAASLRVSHPKAHSPPPSGAASHATSVAGSVGVHIPEGFVDLTHGLPQDWAGKLPPDVEQLAKSGTKLALAVDFADAGLQANLVADRYRGLIPEPSAINAARGAAAADLAKAYPAGTRVEILSAEATRAGTVEGTRVVLAMQQEAQPGTPQAKSPVRTVVYFFPAGDEFVTLAFSTNESLFAAYESRFDAAALATTGLRAPSSSSTNLALHRVAWLVASGIGVAGALAFFASRRRRKAIGPLHGGLPRT